MDENGLDIGKILGILLVCLLFLVVFALPWSIGVVKIVSYLTGGGGL